MNNPYSWWTSYGTAVCPVNFTTASAKVICNELCSSNGTKFDENILIIIIFSTLFNESIF